MLYRYYFKKIYYKCWNLTYTYTMHFKHTGSINKYRRCWTYVYTDDITDHRQYWSHILLITDITDHRHYWAQTLLITYITDHRRYWSHTLLITDITDHIHNWSQVLQITDITDQRHYRLQTLLITDIRKPRTSIVIRYVAYVCGTSHSINSFNIINFDLKTQ